MLPAIIVILVLILFAIVFPKFTKDLIFIMVALGLFFFVASLFGESKDSRATKTVPAAEPATASSASVSFPEQPASEEPPQWRYINRNDPMGKGTDHQAAIQSINELYFDFPYNGGQHATLTLRVHPRLGKDVIIQVEKGQILCPTYDGCSVLVRFDDEAAIRFSASPPNDGSSETIFLRNYDRFYEKLRKAKNVKITVPVYRQGEPVLQFSVSGFDQKRFMANIR